MNLQILGGAVSAYRRHERLRNAALLIGSVLVLAMLALVPLVAAPRIAQTGSHKPTWAQAVDLAPAAYDGQCEVVPYGQDKLHLRGTDFTQPYLGDTGLHPKGTVPVPCHNLSITTWNEAGKPDTRIQEWTGQDAEKTDKLRFSMTRLPNGSYELNWGPKPGVTVEWLHATIDDHDGLKLIRGSNQHYVWHPHDGVTFPHFILHANDPAAANGRISSITGPPMPMP